MVSVRHMLAELDPDVETTEYDPEQIGKPNPHFKWALYDPVILDDRVGGVGTGLDWFSEFSRTPSFPATIVLTDIDDDALSGKISKLMGTQCLPRANLTTEKLAEPIASLGITPTPNAHPEQAAGGKIDQEIVEKLAVGNMDPSLDLESGYRFVRLIGQGAHSRVYLAERIGSDVALVLKIMDLSTIDDPSAVQRFAQEAELMAEIKSPFVVKFYDHGFTPSYGYIAMEFFTRGDLKQRIGHGVTADTALLYTLQIALRLEAIHTLDIVHRDLKPGNLMFRSDDSLALGDFGISKRLDSSNDLTKTGSIVGTLACMSPEQGLGDPIDQRSDLYATGMILFEMLSGEKAFRASSPRRAGLPAPTRRCT
jgi:tRNA A-37 threonylcarbamoyl transferase component Bud32